MTMIAILRRTAIGAGVALAALGLSTAAFAQKTKLTVYTAIENEQLEPFKKAFEADNPDHRNRLGARFDGRDHGQADRREGQSARRRDLGPRRLERRRCSPAWA